MTSKDTIAAALRSINALASGEPIDSTVANDSLNTLNRMLDSWSTEPLTIYTKLNETFNLTASKQTYAMGTSGTPDFNTARPLRIEEALIQVSGTSPTYELPIRVVNEKEWTDISIKPMTSTIPIYLFPDYAFPNCNLSFWPVPSVNQVVSLWSWKALAQFADLTTDNSFPPGYSEAIIYNLALRLAPEYGKTVTPELVELAANAKANIKRANHRPLLLQVDKALLPDPSTRTFNRLTGDTT